MLTQNIFATSIERILRGENLHDFGEWFAKESAAYSPDLPEFKEPGTWRRSALLTARAIWAQVPVPSNGWRARGLPEIGRNDACYCGSGHKYKQCCEPNARNFHLPQEIDMRWITLCELEGEQLIQCVRAMPADMLGEAGLSWNLQGRPEQTVAAMEELFSGAHKLNDRHETALDALLSAYLDMGLESKRLALAQRLVSHPAKELASCAALRWVGMLSDSGQTAQAWAVFQQAKQRNPRYVPWLYSEMTLLISEGRQDEARQRAPLLAAQARKIGIPELADAILAMGERGLAGLNDIRDPQADDDNAFDPDDADIERDIAAFKAWVALIPEQLDMQAASAMYETIVLDDFDSPIAKALPRAIELRKSKALANLDKRWHRQFAVEKPETTNLYGDPVDCFDQEAQVLAFLTKNPQAWFSWDIVDDLLLCAADLRDDASPPELKSAILKLSQWAVQLLRASTEGHAAQLPWAIMNNRPALRCLAQAIQTAADRHDNAVCEQWLSWGLQLNPNDNHGWRELLVERYMHTGRFDEALEVLLRYPSDFPPALHQRSLCYFVQGQPEQAEAILRTAHDDFPNFASSLVPDVLDRPQEESGPGLLVGGQMQAWLYRMEMRSLWLKTGALSWLKTLNLPKPPPEKPKQTTHDAQPAKAKQPMPHVPSFDEIKADMTALAKRCNDLPRLHGIVSGIAWSPGMVMPGQWIGLLQPVMKPLTQKKGISEIDAINQDLQQIMLLCNQLNAAFLVAEPSFDAAWKDISSVAGKTDNDLHAWASGFMQASELAGAAWKKAGHPVSTKSHAFATLMQLAALAAPSPSQAKPSVLQQAWQAGQDDGHVLLLDANAQPEHAEQQLKLALQSLWSAVLPIRQARMQGR